MIVNNKRIPIKSIILVGLLPSFLKILFYKIVGYKIESNVKIGFGSIIIGKNVSICEGTEIGFFSIIQCDECFIKKNVEIGSLVYMKVDKIQIGYQTVIRESCKFGGMDIGKSEFIIGNLSHVHQNCVINTTRKVSIGNNTAIGGGTFIFTHSSWQSALEGYPFTFVPVVIGNNVWISWGVFILPGVNIGNGTLVSAGSIVTKNLPEKCLASGNPAKPIIPSGLYPRELHPDERVEIILNILNNFATYLISKGLSNKITKNDDYTSFTFHDNGKKSYNIFFLNNTKALLPTDLLTKNSVLVLDGAENTDYQLLIDKKQIALIDLFTKKTFNNNTICDEVVKFFKHYGLRFKKEQKV